MGRRLAAWDAFDAKRVQFRPLWIAAGLPLLLIAVNSTPVGSDLLFVIAGTPMLMLVLACVGVWTALTTFRWLRNRTWLQASVGAVRARGSELDCGYYAIPFPGHFTITKHWYLVSFPC
jgi:hypothetical protein